MRAISRGMAVTTALLTLAVASASAGLSRPAAAQDEIRGAVAQPVSVDNVMTHTVVRTERWYGGGIWMAKVGEVGVTVQVKIEATADTPFNRLYYGLRTPDGKLWSTVWLGNRKPSLSAGQLHAGESATGWLTWVVPEAHANGLALVFYARGSFGSGSTLTVPLGVVPESPTAKVGQSVVVDGQVRHTFVRAERWVGEWKPKVGNEYFTFLVKVKALKPIKAGASFYSLRTADGKWFRKILFGTREPELASSRRLAAGGVLEGWVTMMIPRTRFGQLKLVYHLPDEGANLVLPLRIPAT